jgi:pantetheine-phosphate adenylyltransferase
VSDGERIAVCPGSYDPVTNGHLDILSRASKIFDKIVVGVVGNAPRKTGHLFTPEERVELIEAALAGNGIANVEVRIFRTLLVEFARECGAVAIVKGLRAISDFEYEFEMNQLNRQLAPDIESVFILASPGYSFIRSSGVKEIAAFGGDVSEFVPPQIAKALIERLDQAGE